MCSAPDAHACQSTSFQDNSDTTGPEQSDAQPYEWDDYKPPAKIEDGWCTDEQQDASSLTLEDDYQMQLGNEIHSLIAESRASLRSAASLLNRHPSHRSLEDLKTLATANADRLMIALSTIPEMNASNRCDIADISRQWKVLLSNIDALSNRCAAESTSLLIRMQPSHVESSDSGCSSPPILSKLEKFLSSSKLLLEDDDIDVSLSSLSPIKSLADVVNALHVCHDLRDRLIRKREEWNSLLRSGSLNELPDVIADSDYKSVSDAYEDVISKFEQLVEQVETVKQYWSDWTDTQKKLRSLMRDIESEIAQLRNGDVDSKHIRAELEMCQERMSRLETVCNYLTSGMSMLNDGSSVDFVSELTVYSNALLKLKTSFDEIMRSTGKSEKSVFVQTTRRRSRKSPPKTKSPSVTVKPSLITSFGLAARESWILKGLILLSVFVAFFAWLTSFQSGVPNNWRNSFGPHLDYVNGPPLV